MPPDTSRTVPDLFLERVGRTPDAEAFRYPIEGGWRSLTWLATESRVRAVAGGLRALGVASGEVCAILSATRIEWVLADYGILCAGSATSAIYPSSTAEECAFILSDSGAVVVFVDGEEQVAKLVSRRPELPALRRVVVFDGRPTEDGWVMTLAELEARGREHDLSHPGSFEEVASSVREDAVATLLYTSGTTGRPKGVELTHRCWVSQSRAVEESGILDHPDGFQLFWLPLAHSFGKMVGTAQLRIGFGTAVDGRIDKIVENLAVLRPTFVCAVPRIFEKVHAKVLSGAREGGAVKAAVFRWALEVGLAARREEWAGRSPGPLLAAQRALADRLVFRRIRDLFGGRLRFFVSGSAPLAREVTNFFDAMGLVILEGYGLTETSAATHCNKIGAWRIGSVGRPFPGMEVRIAEDGEVLVRGPWVMRGYHGLPEQTAEALDAEGWMHTGDVGQVDADGFLTITDRKKDLIKTSGGKFVAPADLESRIKIACPLVSQVLVVGDRRSFVSALLTLDPEATRRWAAGDGFEEKDLAALSRLPELRAVLQRGMDKVNAALPRFATVKRFRVLPAEFSEAAGELTPSQKLKRKVIEARYRSEIEAIYGEGRSAVAVP
ncbi:MAG TPA: long-chain fatty acid--CoA ligase [Anaeromyxobacter sp.]|nr:long-chain fatty acid--CoA ligase [Anaeromyxobacter sp.]